MPARWPQYSGREPLPVGRQCIRQQLVRPVGEPREDDVRAFDRARTLRLIELERCEFCMVVVHCMAGFQVEVELAAIAQLDAGLALDGHRELGRQGEQHVPGLLDRFDDGQPHGRRRAPDQVGKAMRQQSALDRGVAVEEAHRVRRPLARQVVAELDPVLEVPRPMVVVLIRVLIDHPLVRIIGGLDPEHVAIEVTEAQDERSHAREERQALARRELLVTQMLKEGMLRIVTLETQDVLENGFHVEETCGLREPGIVLHVPSAVLHHSD
jgi:hypothetical protein